MKRVIFSFFLLLLMLSCRHQPEVWQYQDIPFVPMEAERLPDLHEPRIGQAVVWAGDHIVVMGGHTTGFVPSKTAEYYAEGCWHSVPMIYPHDMPFALVLKNGDVWVGGGYESSFGIGQTWGIECYHPDNHTFTPVPIMEKKRARPSAVELQNGDILISGNWFGTDFIEKYLPHDGPVILDTASENRSYPFILPMDTNNAYIFGSRLNSYLGTPIYIVDQLEGEPFTVDLFDEWHPCNPFDRNVQADAYRMAENTYLILAVNDKGQYAPMVVGPDGFSLLPMDHALPRESPWGAIRYTGAIWVTPETNTAWLMAVGDDNRAYLAEIQYTSNHLTLHYTQPLKELPLLPWELLLPDGSFVTAGGFNGNNYEPNASVFAFFPQGKPSSHSAWLLWVVALCCVMGLLLAVVLVRKSRRSCQDTPAEAVPSNEEEPSSQELPSNGKRDLSGQLKTLMEEQQLFINKDLRLADVASALGTNTTYLSACLNGELNTTFPAFVTGYRIQYAQELMRKDPTMRLSQVAEASGFTNEKTFLRAFKASCGCTPSEWKQDQAQKEP